MMAALIGITRLVPFCLRMTPRSGDPFVMTGHTIDALTGFGKDELFDAIRARATAEAVCMIGFLPSDDGFIGDRKFADRADIGAVLAHWGAIREEE